MKTFYLLALTCFFMVMPQHAEAKRINVHGTIHDQNGGAWNYTGWIEFDICCPPALTHFDIWVTGPDGKRYHFTGMAAPGGQGNGWNISPLYDDLGNLWPLNTIPWGTLITEFEQIVSQQPPE
jgi:hypothetical protein